MLGSQTLRCSVDINCSEPLLEIKLGSRKDSYILPERYNSEGTLPKRAQGSELGSITQLYTRAH
jgi:hypothetical protein